MNHSFQKHMWLLSALFAIAAAQAATADEAKLLWQIGKPDDNTAELALGPKDYASYGEDPVFAVGISDPKRDWPYVQPGPTDAWAGSRPHTFTILFGLADAPQGECRLLVDLADTHDRTPPQLAIRINGGKPLLHQTPQGGPDDSIFGDPSRGREHRFALKIPPDALKSGTNEITIRTCSGSWVLYDAVALESPAGASLAPVERATTVGAVECPAELVDIGGKLCQTVRVTIRHFGKPTDAAVSLGGGKPVPVTLKPGSHTVKLRVPPVETETPLAVEVRVAGKTIARRDVSVKPVRKWVVYLLPHSHVDVGYTKLQTEVERDHWRFYEQAIEAARRTADYPPGARFKWNVEVLWAVDGYLKQASPEKQQQFIDAVRKGWIGLDALYGNELTALCRPEELVRLVDFAQRLSKRCGVKINSAMITDVPGYTWGLTTVLAEAGVKYFSIGPNSSARIGNTYYWGDKPFRWITPDGRHKVLCWIPRTGYYRTFNNPAELLARLRQLEQAKYPYDLVQVRYCLGDNHGPGVAISEMVKQWNAEHAYPRLVIATTAEMFEEFERRYGDVVPEARGDFTPYWEDGAASSARETGLNRASAERLCQAEALFAATDPRRYPADDFYAAWRNVLLYDEHTWGAHNSISQPDGEFAQGQWKIKQAFALDGDKRSRALLASAVSPYAKRNGPAAAVMVFNTASWPRTDLVVLPEKLATAGDRVKDPGGEVVASQRLSTGQLAFVARDVPPFGAKRFTIESGQPSSDGQAKAIGDNVLVGDRFRVAIDPKTGAISSLRAPPCAELVDSDAGLGLNDYFYVPGKDPKDAQRNGPVKITVKEAGPLVASLLVESDAPGCRKLSREIRLIDGIDRVDIINVVDKEKIRTKEGVHFAFPFTLPGGVMRMDIPWAVVRPETDQLPGACKNWFTVQRFVDVSNAECGVTWATLDAPLVEVGSITAETPWIKTLRPTQTLYSYVMNNYWFTNYKADQEGPTLFRYSLRPHTGPYDAVDAARFGIERSRPLVVVPVGEDAPAEIPSRLRVQGRGAIVTAFKPSRDGKALVVRLFGVGSRDADVTLAWSDPAPTAVRLSNLAEEPGREITGSVTVPAQGMVTLRAEFRR